MIILHKKGGAGDELARRLDVGRHKRFELNSEFDERGSSLKEGLKGLRQHQYITLPGTGENGGLCESLYIPGGLLQSEAGAFSLGRVDVRSESEIK